MNRLQHVTLTTGHLASTDRSEVAEEVMAALALWLARALAVKKPVALPTPALMPNLATALAAGGDLVVTVYAAPDEPLVSVGCTAVASAQLWDLMVSSFGAVAGLREPDAPWCAVALHPHLIRHPEAASWLADFERSIAWVWIDRHGI